MNLLLRKSTDRSKPNRRDFMVQTTSAGLGITSMVNTLSHLQLMGTSAMAAGPSDMKALVCIFLAGGNDSNNLLIPRAGQARTEYENSRGLPLYNGGPGGIAIPLSELAATEITPDNSGVYDPTPGYTNNDMALHPSCQALRDLFEAGDLAFLANVGTLADDTVTRANFDLPSTPKPIQLFSHSDQVLQWQSSIADRPFVRGWGGGIADILHTGANTNTAGLAMGVSLSGVNSFQVGQDFQPFIMSSAGAQSFSGFGTNPNYSAALNDTTLKPFGTVGAGGYDPLQDTNYKNTQEGWRLKALERLMAMSHENLFDTSFEATAKNARKTEGVVSELLTYTSATSGNDINLDSYFNDAFGSATAANNDFANQLKMVARLIIGNWTLMNNSGSPYRGNNRMTFYVQQGGYDTHASQIAVNGNNTVNTGAGQYALLSTLSRAIKGFRDAINNHPRGGIPLWNKVIGFSSSDFNRTFTPNKTDSSGGSDHGWGGHAFMLGGPIKGKKIYGQFPLLTVGPDTGAGTMDCTGTRGRWIPSTAVEQYTVKFAEWLGVSTGDIPEIFPNLGRFVPGTNLDFIDFTVT
jgi:uncharacterized protein (DUF1501 family)